MDKRNDSIIKNYMPDAVMPYLCVWKWTMGKINKVAYQIQGQSDWVETHRVTGLVSVRKKLGREKLALKMEAGLQKWKLDLKKSEVGNG